MHAPRSVSRHSVKSLVVGAVLATLVSGLAACGGDAESADAKPATPGSPVEIADVGTVEADETLAGLLPAEVADAEQVTIATNAPPSRSSTSETEGNTDEFTGLKLDLFTAASARLGIKRARSSQQPFDGLVPGLQAGKYDAIAGGITDTKERQQVATFVDYSASGAGFPVVGKGNPKAVKSVADLCGTNVAAQNASKQVGLPHPPPPPNAAATPITVKDYRENPQAVADADRRQRRRSGRHQGTT